MAWDERQFLFCPCRFLHGKGCLPSMCVPSIIVESQLILNEYTSLRGWLSKLGVPSTKELQDTHLEAETLKPRIPIYSIYLVIHVTLESQWGCFFSVAVIRHQNQKWVTEDFILSYSFRGLESIMVETEWQQTASAESWEITSLTSTKQIELVIGLGCAFSKPTPSDVPPPQGCTT